MSDTQSFEDPTVEEKLSLGVHAAALIVVSVVALVGNTVATDNTVPEGLVGLIVLWLIGIVMTLPWTPGSAWVLEKVGHVNFLTLATPCLAYAGIAIAKREIEIAKTSGWKIAVVAVLVMTGTYVGSAIVAQMFL